MAQEYAYYVARISLPDTDRLMLVHAIKAANDADMRMVLDHVRRIVTINPDAKINPDQFIIAGPFDHPDKATPIIQKFEEQMNAADPNRASLTSLKASGTIDVSQRLLHDPEISRMLAGQKAAAAKNADALASADAPASAIDRAQPAAQQTVVHADAPSPTTDPA